MKSKEQAAGASKAPCDATSIAPSAGLWQAGRFELAWTAGRPLIMGIVNVTPDSFSDGGRYAEADLALAHARALLDAGAQVLDVGAESTRPGAQAVNEDAEWARLEPVLRELVRWDVPLSVDTMKVSVMRKALSLGVDILNDVNGFRAEGADALLAHSGCGAVVMHMQGEPRTMQLAPQYGDVTRDVVAFLQQRVDALGQVGVQAARVLVDPGFGFGKTLQHNLELMRATPQFATLAAGVLIGVSRKRMIGELCGQDEPSQRVAGSVAAGLYAARQGAAVLRVHDVRETADALAVQSALAAD